MALIPSIFQGNEKTRGDAYHTGTLSPVKAVDKIFPMGLHEGEFFISCTENQEQGGDVDKHCY